MPNTNPIIDNVSMVDFIKRRGRDKSKINIFPTASLTKNLEGMNMTEFGLLKKKGKIQGLRIAICGDILHSRVARSNIYLLNMLGAEVNIIAPTNLMPKDLEKFGVNKFSDMKKGLKDCDIVMMLRLQNERMNSSFLASNREYYEYYGLTPDKLNCAKNDALIMHPGPMNRGIEIDTNLADDINKSVIQEQVELGVAVRMACLKIFCK